MDVNRGAKPRLPENDIRPFVTLPWSSNLSRSRKELYQDLVVDSASDPLVDQLGWSIKEVRSHWNWAQGSGSLNNEFLLTESVASLPSELQNGPGRHTRCPRCGSGLEETAKHSLPLLRASSTVFGSCRRVDGLHRTQAARAVRCYLRR